MSKENFSISFFDLVFCTATLSGRFFAFLWSKKRWSSISECSDPQLTGKDYYGNGLLNFAEKSFCKNGICKELTVCQITTNEGEENYYLPLDGVLNKSKEFISIISTVAHYFRAQEKRCQIDQFEVKSFNPILWNNLQGNGGGENWKAHTEYDAVRLIQNSDGLFLKLNDGTFTRNYCHYACEKPGIMTRIMPFTMASDCKQQSNPAVVSTADLRRTSIKFSTSILPYFANGSGASGKAVLSQNNQVMTITAKGRV